MEKRGRFIGKIHSLRQEFGNVDPMVYMALVSVYLSSFYGSNLWDLNGAGSQRLYATWNIMVRMTFNIPRESHRYLIQPISGQKHLKVQLLKRFKNFVKILNGCNKPHLRYLAQLQENDMRSTYGRNCRNLCNDANVNTPEEVNIENISYIHLSPEESWRVPFLKELLEVKAGRLQTELSKRMIIQLIIDVATS